MIVLFRTRVEGVHLDFLDQKGGPTLEMEVLEHVLDPKCCLEAVLSKALLKLHGPSSCRTGLMVGTITVLIYWTMWAALQAQGSIFIIWFY